MKGEQEASVKTNIRSGEPVQNIINVNIWVDIYIAISSSHIFIWKQSYTHSQKIQDATSHRAVGVGATNVSSEHTLLELLPSVTLNLWARGPCGFHRHLDGRVGSQVKCWHRLIDGK